MICLVLFIVNILYGWLSPKPALKTTDIATKVQPSTDKKETVAKTAALQTNASVDTRIETQKETPPVFTLNGVFFSGNEGYALINNRIVKQGDKIDGATVVQIFLDEVDLDFGGSIIKLSSSSSNSTK